MSTSAQNSMVALFIPYSSSGTEYAINELDQVAGSGYQSLSFGFLWDNGNVNRIYGLSGCYTEAYDINDWKQIDVPAFNQLVLRYQGVAYNVAFRILGRADAAEDATQDAFLSAYRAIGTLRGSSFQNWLLRIVTNKCLDQLRTRKRRSMLALDGLPFEPEYLSRLADPGESPHHAVERQELAQVLQEAILALPPGQRSVLVLADVQGLTYQEVAEVLGISLGTVKSRLSRARGSLRAQLLVRRGALPAWIHPVEMRHPESGGAPVDWSFAPPSRRPLFSARAVALAPLTSPPNSPQANREGAVRFE